MELPKNSFELINRWHKRLREMQFSQYNAADHFARLNKWYGIPIIIISIMVGSSIFVSLKEDWGPIGKLIFGFLSVITTILTGLQTFLKFNERAEKHKSAGANAAILRRKVEQLISKGNAVAFSNEELDDIRKDYDALSTAAPSVPKAIWRATLEELQSDQ